MFKFNNIDLKFDPIININLNLDLDSNFILGIAVQKDANVTSDTPILEGVISQV